MLLNTLIPLHGYRPVQTQPSMSVPATRSPTSLVLGLLRVVRDKVGDTCHVSEQTLKLNLFKHDGECDNFKRKKIIVAACTAATASSLGAISSFCIQLINLLQFEQ